MSEIYEVLIIKKLFKASRKEALQLLKIHYDNRRMWDLVYLVVTPHIIFSKNTQVFSYKENLPLRKDNHHAFLNVAYNYLYSRNVDEVLQFLNKCDKNAQEAYSMILSGKKFNFSYDTVKKIKPNLLQFTQYDLLPRVYKKTNYVDKFLYKKEKGLFVTLIKDKNKMFCLSTKGQYIFNKDLLQCLEKIPQDFFSKGVLQSTKYIPYFVNGNNRHLDVLLFATRMKHICNKIKQPEQYKEVQNDLEYIMTDENGRLYQF